MLTHKQEQAISLLFQFTPEETAERLGIALKLLRRWLTDRDFCRALGQRCRERRESAHRIALEGALAAAKAADAAVRSGDDKPLSKAAMDMLKLSGIFNQTSEADGPEASLADLVARAREQLGEEDG